MALTSVIWLLLGVLGQVQPEGLNLVVDDMEAAVQERWAGAGMAVVAEAREGAQALRWEVEASIASSEIPHDWSHFDRLEMWMHSAQAGNAIIALVLSSDNPDTLPDDYFIAHIPVDWEGWRLLELPFRAVRRVGLPAGFGKIDSIAFHATGWQTAQRPGTVLTIDAIALAGRAPGEDLVISDMEADIASWSTLVPDVGFVKEGQQSGAWLDTLNDINVRNRDVPPDWSGYEYLCFWMHSQAANPAASTEEPLSARGCWAATPVRAATTATAGTQGTRKKTRQALDAPPIL